MGGARGTMYEMVAWIPHKMGHFCGTFTHEVEIKAYAIPTNVPLLYLPMGNVCNASERPVSHQILLRENPYPCNTACFQITLDSYGTDVRRELECMECDAFVQPTYGNETACQLLSNLCVMLIYLRGSDSAPTACNLYFKKGVPDGAAFTEDWYVL